MTTTSPSLGPVAGQRRVPTRPPSSAGRVVLLLPAGLALLAGLDAALLLLGLPAPVSAARLPEVHGMLLVLGFVGTLIALERAVALRHRAGLAVPGALGVGGLLLLSPAPLWTGQWLLVLGASGLVAVLAALWRRQRDEAVLVQVLAAVLATGAAVLWLGGVPVPLLVPWLVAFVVLTIGGERLELARLAMGPCAGAVLALLASTVAVATVGTLLWPAVGTVLLGAAMLTLVGWLAVHDVARRTVRATGAPRFMAACMLAGYGWLAVAGAVWLLGGPAPAGARYDTVVHAVFIGFTLSMVMAHAPVILPAVLRRALPYTPLLWVPPALLHGSLVLRLWVGDALGVHAAWQIGGLLNIVAVLAFVAITAGSVGRAGERYRSAR